ncbi:hypothetical protein HK413_02575 [Mucilaginibacter sp. S1162]|uniref:Uncharacterized protein n=1 Tax=Mucilaginibacter humi TaxID=2732510 RepID=A0ABX1W5J6_9SPHI|nr:hypothetical protein [Mucilaginibacter humi]NNU33322.1 hypothetical protein [Mucilaginibacter humi]
MRRIITIGILILLSASLFAQETPAKKLKDVQPGNMRAPSAIKIDGKLGEWNNNFQAYNRATRIVYILCNDDKNLYTVAKSTDFTTTAKIISGGITLTINTDGKKKSKDGYSVTFPVIEHPELLAGGMSNRFENRNAGADTELMRTVHQRTILAAKQIKVLGIKSIPDTIISIYNEHGIKTAINFDGADLTFEMAIPLRLINLTVDNAREFAYNVTLTGFRVEGRNPGGGGGGGHGGGGRNALDFMDW